MNSNESTSNISGIFWGALLAGAVAGGLAGWWARQHFLPVTAALRTTVVMTDADVSGTNLWRATILTNFAQAPIVELDHQTWMDRPEWVLTIRYRVDQMTDGAASNLIRQALAGRDGRIAPVPPPTWSKEEMVGWIMIPALAAFGCFAAWTLVSWSGGSSRV